ncbi:hypothetical protein MLD38_020839 [Melastoma candidum]|uniref:Uncharacterized protein n=1 Tax=Melastoma candidum TaxID=119954 RepID=A0ACB9QMA3_9MYRT|nr:hypothetical protein MLD38_020839 [Melastoma candidum]
MEHRDSSLGTIGVILLFITGVPLLFAGVGLACDVDKCKLDCPPNTYPTCVFGTCGCDTYPPTKQEVGAEDLPIPKVP